MEPTAANSKKRPVETAAAEHAHMYPVVRRRLEQEIAMKSSSLKSRKRVLELMELDDYVAMETTGAYEPAVKPKRFKFPDAINRRTAKSTGIYVRFMLLIDATEREILAKAAARGRH